MNRYLFRAKRKDNGDWVEGSLIDKDYILRYIDLAESWEGSFSASDHKITCRAYEIIPETVCLWAGLLDKNGQKIWEGSCIKQISAFGNYSIIYVVIYQKYQFIGVSIQSDKYGAYTTHLFINENYPILEVVGNKWDNPELLTQ